MATIFHDRGVAAWSRMYQFIDSRFAQSMGGLAKGTKVLINPVAQNSAWDNRNKLMRLLEENRWADLMPGLAWLYVRSVGKRVSDGYAKFLHQCIVTAYARSTLDKELKDALQGLWELQTHLQGALSQATEEAEAAYANHVATTPPKDQLSKVDFFERNGHQTKINVIREQLRTAGTNAAMLAPKLSTPPDVKQLLDALERFQQPSQQTPLPINEETLNEPKKYRPLFNSYVEGGYERMLEFLKESQPNAEYVNEQSKESSYFNQHFSASIDVKFLGLFRAGGASGEYDKTEERIRQDTTALEIGWDNMSVFQIERDTWYSDQIIDTWAPRFTRERFLEYFGPNGGLEVLPVGLLVARGLRFRLHTSSFARDFMSEHIRASADGGIRVGWFTIGGRAGYSTSKEETKVETFENGIAFTDLTGRGKVLAVLTKHVASAVDTPKEVAMLNQWMDPSELQRLQKIAAVQRPFGSVEVFTPLRRFAD